jgi:hypothetical protein
MTGELCLNVANNDVLTQHRLLHEEKGGKWLWPVDTVAPIEI